MRDEKGDAELLELWRAGDSRAGGELMDRNFPRIKKFFASKTSEYDLIKELTQRTFERCLEKVHAFEGRSSFSSFIYGIARNILLESIRERRRAERDVPIEDISIENLDPTPFSLVEQRGERKLIIHALRRLPLTMQIIAELYLFEDLSGREVAEILELSEGTVRGRIRACREQLQGHIHDLAESPEQLESTLMTLSAWAQEIREQI